MARQSSLLLVVLAVVVAAPGFAAVPEGYLDAATPTLIGGWARDPDFGGPIAIHIYIDGVMHKALLADGTRPDVPCSCGYTWLPPPLGPGTHRVTAYAIGVDSVGEPNGENPELAGSPIAFTGNCDRLAAEAFIWCRDNPGYWINRPTDTHYLSNEAVRVGVNGSYGGTILELYAADWNDNFLLEHGGGAMQLSLWGYDPVGDAAFFRLGICDPTPYAECPAGWGPGCMYLCCSRGAHVANCSSVMACEFTAGAPYNPIQAQGADCGWENAGNDVTALGINPDPPWIHIRKENPQQFTKSNAFAGLTWEQVARLHPAGIQVDYTIRYSGAAALNEHNQELPALFPAPGMNAVYYFYDGDAPFTGGGVTSATAPPEQGYLMLPDREFLPAGDPGWSFVMGQADEYWATACNADESKCLTVAGFSPAIRWLSANGSARAPYLTPTGRFAMVPGLDLSLTVYVFPYRFDRVVAGHTIREHVQAIAATVGCLATGMRCDDGDPCTSGDSCRDGTCTGDPGGCADGGPDADADFGADSGADDGTDGGDGLRPDVSRDDGTAEDARGDGDGGGPSYSDGCACRSAARTTPAGTILLWLVAVVALVLERRRTKSHAATRTSGRHPARTGDRAPAARQPQPSPSPSSASPPTS
jgi:MYXO-CTERM domain-containing protein